MDKAPYFNFMELIHYLILDRGDITALNASKAFELYVLQEDLTVNPIPKRADKMRTQAVNDGGLCTIEIPAYTDVDDFLDTVVSSVTGADCDVNVCRSEGCQACTKNGGCNPCSSSFHCDGLANIQEYRYCDCDVVVTINEKDEFAMYTGKKKEVLIRLLHLVHSHLFIPFSSIIQGR